MLVEILTAHDADLALACQTIPYGAASVGQALGLMAAGQKFPRPSCVFLDGDRGPSDGCLMLPGEDAPERVVFEPLRDRQWRGLSERIGRPYPDVVDACNRAMTLTNSHDWVREAARRLFLGSDNLWQAMCAEWATACLDPADAKEVTQPIRDTLVNAQQILGAAPRLREPVVVAPSTPEPIPEPVYPNEPQQLF